MWDSEAWVKQEKSHAGPGVQLMGINQDQPRTFLRDDIRIVLEDRRIALQHSHWLRRYQPDVLPLEGIKTIHALVEEPWVLSLLITDIRGKLYLVDEKMSGWKELLEELPKLLDGFNAEAVTETQRYLRNPLLCWGQEDG
jgi:hypothetical protein